MTPHHTYTAIAANKTVTVAITSDRGLCGGLNSNITKYTRALLRMNDQAPGAVGLQAVGVGSA
jgi:F-type H+-transporting ATPase subunit gamma